MVGEPVGGRSASGRSGWPEAGPAPGALAPGAMVAGYRLEQRIGAGGMAVVFRATDERLGRTVALKVVTPALAGDDGFRERFIRESRAAAAVDHPHIIPVYGAGEDRGILYLAMRYVSGGDLGSLLRREGPLPAERAAFLLSPVASALDAAHAAGLVHRDVKPANVLVDMSPGRPEHPYLSDFGLAKGTTSATGLTGTGQFIGTIDYIAPEQISGGRAHVQTDQYALACVAFTLLTARLPFAREAPMAVLWAHLNDPPPSVTAYRFDLPPAVDQVLGRALAKDPAARYPSCGAFADALRAALGLGSYSVPAPAYPGPPSRDSAAYPGPPSRDRIAGPPPGMSVPPSAYGPVAPGDGARRVPGGRRDRQRRGAGRCDPSAVQARAVARNGYHGGCPGRLGGLRGVHDPPHFRYPAADLRRQPGRPGHGDGERAHVRRVRPRRRGQAGRRRGGDGAVRAVHQPGLGAGHRHLARFRRQPGHRRNERHGVRLGHDRAPGDLPDGGAPGGRLRAGSDQPRRRHRGRTGQRRDGVHPAGPGIARRHLAWPANGFTRVRSRSPA